MILPTKHIKLQKSLLNVGATLLANIGKNTTVTLLWEKARKLPETKNYETFTLGLDFLFTLGLIWIQDGIIWRVDDDKIN